MLVFFLFPFLCHVYSMYFEIKDRKSLFKKVLMSRTRSKTQGKGWLMGEDVGRESGVTFYSNTKGQAQEAAFFFFKQGLFQSWISGIVVLTILERLMTGRSNMVRTTFGRLRIVVPLLHQEISLAWQVVIVVFKIHSRIKPFMTFPPSYLTSNPIYYGS